jgi:putative FmdB family regulatory protein
MPIYEYECGACGHQLEVIQKLSDEPLRICPTCGKEALKKLLSAPGFRLKGTGWYETDFKHGNKSKGDKAKGGDTKPSGSGTGGGSGS